MQVNFSKSLVNVYYEFMFAFSDYITNLRIKSSTLKQSKKVFNSTECNYLSFFID